MEMIWAQTLTIVISMGGLFLWMWRVSKEDADKIRKNMEKDDERHAAEIKRHDAEFQEARKLWASILQKSAEIEKEHVIVKQKLLDAENKSFGIEHEIRELIKKL